ncbi:aldehyde dehydrogenase family protein, partial [Parafrankia soli]|uniref:aldehyde dehydrogenase family protein n=1 Tax=Parafrankia soli TaxID=2599596 RepID=UPI000E2ECCAA
MTAVVDFPVIDPVQRFIAETKGLLIGGEWRPAQSGRTFPTHDPASGEKITDVAHGTAADIDLAVAAARRAYDGPWSRFTPSQRQSLLWKVGDALLARAKEFGQLESIDNGKSAAIAEGVDVVWAANVFHYYAGWATK